MAGPGRSSQTDEEIARGCRRIVGFVVFIWIALGGMRLLAGNVPGFVGLVVPFAILAVAVFFVARARRRGRAAPEGEAPSRLSTSRTRPPRLPRTPEATSASSRDQPGKKPAAPSPPAAPISTDRPSKLSTVAATNSLEEALEELGVEPSDDSDLENLRLPTARPKTSQELIDEARKKWGADRGKA